MRKKGRNEFIGLILNPSAVGTAKESKIGGTARLASLGKIARLRKFKTVTLWRESPCKNVSHKKSKNLIL